MRTNYFEIKLQTAYKDFTSFKRFCDVFEVHKMIGFDTPENAWRKNPYLDRRIPCEKWPLHIRDIYKDLPTFEHYCYSYGLLQILGYHASAAPSAIWAKNPVWKGTIDDVPVVERVKR